MVIYMKGSVIMAAKNDERVLQLKGIIEKKRTELRGGRRGLNL